MMTIRKFAGLLISLVAVCSVSAQETSPPLFDFNQDIRVFTAHAFMNAAGIDGEWRKAGMHPLRIEVRQYLTSTLDSSYLHKLREFAAVDKLCRLFDRQALRLDENVERLLSRLAAVPLKRLQVKVGDKMVLVDTADVAWFEAKDKYTFLHTTDQKYIVDLTLAELESKLDTTEFVRIHRSTIVNLKHMLELVKWFGGKYKMRLKDKGKTELVVSRGYVDRIHRL